MTTDEFELFVVIAAVIAGGSALCRQRVRRNLAVFVIGCLFGLVAQLPLGRTLNLYTPNITMYVWYVSLAVIGAWGCGLTTAYIAHFRLRTLFRLRSHLAAYAIAGIPVILVLEIIGSDLIGMKLHDYHRYAALLSTFGAMNAPPWLYLYYCVCGLAFYTLLRALGLHTENWAGSRLAEAIRGRCSRETWARLAGSGLGERA